MVTRREQAAVRGVANRNAVDDDLTLLSRALVHDQPSGLGERPQRRIDDARLAPRDIDPNLERREPLLVDLHDARTGGNAYGRRERRCSSRLAVDDDGCPGLRWLDGQEPNEALELLHLVIDAPAILLGHVWKLL